MTAVDAIQLERRINAPPAAVYAYLTDSVLWARWQGHSAVVEAEPGGVFRVTMADGSTAEGRFLDVVPDARVVFTWGWHGNPSVPVGSSTVEIDLMPDGDGTLLRLTHRGLPLDDRPIHRAGWEHYLPRLAIAASGGDPGPGAPDSAPG